MKLKSKILAHKKPLIDLEIGDSYNQKSHFVEEKISIQNGKMEQITSANLICEGVVILDFKNVFFDSTNDTI